MIRGYISDIKREFSQYTIRKFRSDILAGVTVATVALPLALAFGIGAGADAAAGLITAIIAGIVIGGLSGASFQISGPTGAMTAILVSLVYKYQLPGMFATCFIAGVIICLAGIFKLGKLIGFIPAPVIIGFTSGIAVVIAFGQINNFFGVHMEGETTLEKVLSIRTVGFNVDVKAMLIGILVVALMLIWPKKWSRIVPGSLVAIGLALLGNILFGFNVAEVGAIPKTFLPEVRLTFSSIAENYQNYSNYIVPALSIAALGMIESLLCGATGSRMKNEKFSPGRELVAQGIGNMIIPFFGGVPATAAIARTSVGIKSGGVTRLVSVIHAVVLASFMLLLGDIMSHIPLSALAGVLMVTAWRMNEWKEIQFIFKHRLMSAIAKFLVTMLVTIFFDLTIAIVAGVVFSIALFVMKCADIEITVEKVNKERLLERNVYLPEEVGDMTVVYLSGPLFFGTIEKIRNAVMIQGHMDLLILSMRGVPIVDTSGLRALQDLYDELTRDKVVIMLSGVQNKVRQMMDKSGLTMELGEENFFWSTDLAISAYISQSA